MQSTRSVRLSESTKTKLNENIAQIDKTNKLFDEKFSKPEDKMVFERRLNDAIRDLEAKIAKIQADLNPQHIPNMILDDLEILGIFQYQLSLFYFKYLTYLKEAYGHFDYRVAIEYCFVDSAGTGYKKDLKDSFYFANEIVEVLDKNLFQSSRLKDPLTQGYQKSNMAKFKREIPRLLSELDKRYQNYFNFQNAVFTSREAKRQPIDDTVFSQPRPKPYPPEIKLDMTKDNLVMSVKTESGVKEYLGTIVSETLKEQFAEIAAEETKSLQSQFQRHRNINPSLLNTKQETINEQKKISKPKESSHKKEKTKPMAEVKTKSQPQVQPETKTNANVTNNLKRKLSSTKEKDHSSIKKQKLQTATNPETKLSPLMYFEDVKPLKSILLAYFPEDNYSIPPQQLQHLSPDQQQILLLGLAHFWNYLLITLRQLSEPNFIITDLMEAAGFDLKDFPKTASPNLGFPVIDRSLAHILHPSINLLPLAVSDLLQEAKHNSLCASTSLTTIPEIKTQPSSTTKIASSLLASPTNMTQRLETTICANFSGNDFYIPHYQSQFLPKEQQQLLLAGLTHIWNRAMSSMQEMLVTDFALISLMLAMGFSPTDFPGTSQKVPETKPIIPYRSRLLSDAISQTLARAWALTRGQKYPRA